MAIFSGEKKIHQILYGNKTVKEVRYGNLKVYPSGGFSPSDHTMVYYPFKNDVKDYSGRGQNLVSTSVFFEENALRLPTNGAYSQNISIPITNKFTVSFWAKMKEYTGHGFVFDFRKRRGYGEGFYVYRYNDNNVGFMAQTSPSSEAGSSGFKHTKDSRNHYLYTYDGVWLHEYINGQLNSKHQRSFNINTQDNWIAFGKRYNHEEGAISGLIKEFFIENRVWDQEMVQKYYEAENELFKFNVSNNTISYFPLKTDIRDYSGNNKHITNNNIVNVNGFAYFNGTNATGSMQYQIGYKTISFWIKPEKYNFIIFSSSGDPYLFQIKSDKLHYKNGFGNTITANFGKTLGINEWHHFVFSQDSYATRCYLDGKRISYDRISETNWSMYHIGFYAHNGSYYFKGLMSELIMENRTWGGKDILDYYTSMKKQFTL